MNHNIEEGIIGDKISVIYLLSIQKLINKLFQFI